jgi:hypothetical protein
MGLTYYARGRNLIVNAGHYGYANTAYRSYLLSPEASNVLVMPGEPFDPAAAAYLIRQAVGADGQFYEFTDTAFGGLPRYRSIYQLRLQIAGTRLSFLISSDGDIKQD